MESQPTNPAARKIANAHAMPTIVAPSALLLCTSHVLRAVLT